MTLIFLVGMPTARAAGSFDGGLTDNGYEVDLTVDGTMVVPGGSSGSVNPDEEDVVWTWCAERVVGIVNCDAMFDRYCSTKAADDDANRWRPAYITTRRLARGTYPSGTWTCLNFVNVIDNGPSVQQVREVLLATLPASAATTNPAVSPTTGMVETLVRLPLILHYDGDRELSVEQQIGGRDVRISAYPARFVWTVGTQTVETDLVGRPWEARYPCDQHSCYSYLTAPAFDRIGKYPLSVSVQWIGAYQVDNGPLIQIPGEVSMLSPQLMINVREARAELITGDEEFD